MDPSSRQRWKGLDVLVTLVFFVAIAAPGVGWLTLPREDAETLRRERRRPARLPRLLAGTWRGFPERFEAHFGDTFGFRSTLVRAHNRLKWFVLNATPNDKVVPGENGWLYLIERQSLDAARGAVPFEPEDMNAWQALLEERHAWASAREITYLFVFAPTKGLVYPEHVPARYRRVGPSRADELLEHLERHSDVPVLDLRPALLAEKQNDAPGDYVYYPLGTHWTHRGAFVATREIVERLRPAVPRLRPLGEWEFRKRLVDQPGDTWAGRLYMEDLTAQDVWSLRYKGGEPTAVPYPDVQRGQLYERGGDGPRIALHHDSFGELVMPMLATRASRLACFRKLRHDRRVLVAEKPDAIIDMFVTRTLVGVDPRVLMAEQP